MTKILIAAAAASITFAAPALADERVFTRDGVTYSYTATPKGEAVVLEGSASNGDRFRLVVKNGWVDGYAGNARVSFRAPKRNAAEAVALAQR